MKSQKGSVAVWVIVILVVIIIAGAAYWYLTQNSAQPTTVSTTELQTQQTTSQQPSQTTQTQPAGQNTTAQTQSTAEVNQQTNNVSVSSQTTSTKPQPVTVQNQNGQMTATPTTSNAWQFTFGGQYAEQQQSYVLDYGDGTPQVSVQCQTPATNGQPVCNQLAPLTHTYAAAGTYQVKLLEAFVGAGPGNEQTTTLLSLQVSN